MKYNRFIAALLVCSTLIILPLDVFSKGPSRSSGSSFRSSPSKSSSGWGSKPTAKPSTPSTWGQRSTLTTRPSTSSTANKTQSTVESKVKASPGYKTRTEAVSAFKSKAASDPKVKAELAKSYPTTYASQPATRPAHIPATYNNHTVVYQNGGYGYNNGSSWVPLASYMLLDTMSDAMLMSTMNHHGYHHGPTVVNTHGHPFLFDIVVSAVIFLFIVAIMIAYFFISGGTNGSKY